MKTDALATAIRAATGAGRLALRSFGRPLKVMTKADSSPVTAVDRACEEFLRKTISRDFPDDGFVGEEFGSTAGHREAVWIIDPIDGTKSYIRGVPFWGVLVAREVRGVLTTGVIHLPALDELMYAERGKGAYLNRRRVRVSRVSSLRRACVLHGSLECFVARRKVAALAAVAARAATTRCYGDCWGYSWMLKGGADALIEAEMSPWDTAAPKVIIEEAGGRMTGWDGSDSWRAPSTVASNGLLHSSLLRTLHRP